MAPYFAYSIEDRLVEGNTQGATKYYDIVLGSKKYGKYKEAVDMILTADGYEEFVHEIPGK